VTDSPISGLAAAGTLTGAELVPVVRTGDGTPGLRTTVADIRAAPLALTTAAALSGGMKCQITFSNGSTPLVAKLWTPGPLSISQVGIPLVGAGSALSGWFSAFYGADGVLIPSSTSADLSTILSATGTPTFWNINSAASSITIPAGYFFLSFKQGTATTYPRALHSNGQVVNAFCTSGDPTAGRDTYRFGYGGNAWTTTGVAPATLGTLTADYRGPIWGVR
jgi:hypothetical protein